MKRLKKTIIILLSVLALTSCNKDESENHIVSDITINEISKNFLFQGDILTITGVNFIDENYQTKIKITDLLTGNINEYEITPISNSIIEFEIQSDMGIEKKSLQVIISDKQSEKKNIFIMNRDWYKIRGEDLLSSGIRKVFMKESSPKINILFQNGAVGSYIESNNGFTYSQYTYNNTSRDLMMYNDDYGVIADYSHIAFTSNGFETSTPQATDEYMFTFDYIEKILNVDENGYITTNGFGTHFRSIDQGENIEISASPFEPNDYISNPVQIKKIGKGTNGIFYEFGFHYISSDDHRNIVINSSNGFNSWSIVHSDTPKSVLIYNLIFYDYNLIYSINEVNELVKSTDLAHSWQFVESNVDAFFMKNEMNWYKVSDYKLYKTENSGESWVFELELPNESEANCMEFVDGKILIGGSNYIYIKYE